jgi:pyrroline-5-carboxylate reductase
MNNQHALNKTYIIFIGGGNMAVAILAGLQTNGVAGHQVLVIEPDADKRAMLTKQYGVTTASAIKAIQTVEKYDTNVIILAVKPQQLKAVCGDLSKLLIKNLDSQALVISIAAGIGVPVLSTWLNDYPQIVRVMPNTPAQIQAGASALYALPTVSAKNQMLASAILEAVGAILWLKDEAKMDAVTAISGSGPAYVFYLIEALQAAAESLGLTADEAKLLALQTFAGASQLALQSDLDVKTLRAQVTSKGGTTEQGVAQLEAANIIDIMRRAAQAAAAKSAALGRDLLK